MIKFFCDIEGLQENWIGVSDSWTQAEAKAADDAMSGGWSDYLKFLSGKVESCNLIVNDSVIDDFSSIKEGTVDMMDLRLVGFIGGILQNAVMRLRALGNASARVSSPTVAGKK